MEPSSYINDCKGNLDTIINDFKYDNLDDKDKIFIKLLAGITIVEKDSADADKIFNMLKINYFQNDLMTAHFVNGLYSHDDKILDEYLDIYIEQVIENEITQNDIQSKINYIKNIFQIIKPDLLESIDNKLNNSIGNNVL